MYLAKRYSHYMAWWQRLMDRLLPFPDEHVIIRHREHIERQRLAQLQQRHDKQGAWAAQPMNFPLRFQSGRSYRVAAHD